MWCEVRRCTLGSNRGKGCWESLVPWTNRIQLRAGGCWGQECWERGASQAA